MNVFSIIGTLAAGFLYINEPVVTMRESPNEGSKVVSQALFAENIRVEREVGEWAYIVTPDDYAGWVPAGSFVDLSEPYRATVEVSRLRAHVYAVPDFEYGPLVTLPYGVKLSLLREVDDRWVEVLLPDGVTAFIQRGDITPEYWTKESLPELSKRFIGLPYTWGGRSSFGYDCSGFVQMLYGKMGVSLPRDSGQQVVDSRFQTVSLEEMEPGDLIFFGRSEGKVTHVGLYLGDNQFIQATSKEGQPWIRISPLLECQASYAFIVFRHLLP